MHTAILPCTHAHSFIHSFIIHPSVQSWYIHPPIRQRVNHYDVIKWKKNPCYWPFVRGIHRSPHKGYWRGSSCVFFDLHMKNKRLSKQSIRHHAHYDVTVMQHPGNTSQHQCITHASPIHHHHSVLHTKNKTSRTSHTCTHQHTQT